MDEIKIRNLEDSVVLQLDSMARRHHMSRNKYLCGVLTNHVIAGERKELEEKYRNLVNVVLEVVQFNSKIMREVQQETKDSLNELKREIERLEVKLHDSETFQA